jgi:sugar/nucleoside kinase (ribokinase family)
MMVDMLVIGDMVVDTILSVDHLPIRTGDVQISDYIKMQVGGSGNVLIAAARLGLKTKAFGCVGEDLYGRFLSITLEKEEMDVTDLLFIRNRSTTLSIDLVDKNANHAFVGVVDAEKSLTPKMLSEKKIENTRSIFTSGYSLLYPGPSATVMKAVGKGKPIFFDAGPVIGKVKSSIFEKVLESTTILFLNSEEAEAITRGTDLEKSALMLAEKGPEIVVIKNGAKGCIVAKGNELFPVGGFEVEVEIVDTIGAGDAFDAAFIYGYLNGIGIKETGVLANAVGAITTTKHGAGKMMPTKKEIISFLKKNRVDPVPAWNFSH